MTERAARFGREPSRSAVFVDFDGVLSEIAPTPDAAVIRPGVADLLTHLDERLGCVAVVSGRPVAFLDPMVPSEIAVVGLYGLERRVDGAAVVSPDAERWRPVVADAVAAAETTFGSDVVEPKGLSLTVHYRGAGVDAEEMGRWVDAHADASGLHARRAKQSYELHPPVDLDKGTAVRELANGYSTVAYVGDDLGDLPAFDALDELEAAGVDVTRVAVRSDEAPAALLDRGDVVVDGPAGAEQWLRAVAGAIDGDAQSSDAN